MLITKAVEYVSSVYIGRQTSSDVKPVAVLGLHPLNLQQCSLKLFFGICSVAAVVSCGSIVSSEGQSALIEVVVLFSEEYRLVPRFSILSVFSLPWLRELLRISYFLIFRQVALMATMVTTACTRADVRITPRVTSGLAFVHVAPDGSASTVTSVSTGVFHVEQLCFANRFCLFIHLNMSEPGALIHPNILLE